MPLQPAQPPSDRMPPFGRGVGVVASPRPARGHGRVLVVEDNPINAIVIEAQLEQMGLGCDVAPDGEQALQRLQQGGYDLVLMDCMLPGMSGHAVTEAWRAVEQREGRGRLPIVALTANVLDGHEAVCRAAGMDAYLTKPCSLAALQAAVSHWMPTGLERN